MKGSGTFLKFCFVNGCIGIGIILKSLTVFIYHFQRLGKRGTVKILSYRYIQACDDVITYRQGQHGLGKGKSLLKSIGYPSGPEDFVEVGVRIKTGIAGISAKSQETFINGAVQLYPDCGRVLLLGKVFCTGFPVFDQGNAGIFQDFFR